MNKQQLIAFITERMNEVKDSLSHRNYEYKDSAHKILVEYGSLLIDLHEEKEDATE